MNNLKNCTHEGETPYWIYDGYGIPLTQVCTKCEQEKIKQYRSDIFLRYECEEQIEDDY